MTYITPRDNDAAVEFDHVREARLTLADEYERGFEFGRVLGRLEAIVGIVIGAAAGICLWLVIR